ncbi:glycosyltransferase [Candidatus Woesearchaeota archaeon]|nr:glycosyltransferase [Candidatus Woesearchaeota archaeon]
MNIKASLGTEKTDIIVGIPSYNEESTIDFVTWQVAHGLKKYYSHYSCVIINVDNNSQDNTKQVFLNTDTQGIPKVYVTTEPGVKGKGNNFYNLFKIVKELQPKAVVVVDADLKSITPDWMKKLCQPILEGHDLVTPLYARHKYDGTITNNIVYPIVVGLLCRNIRQPIGGDFSFSTKLAEHWLEQEWSDTIRQYGIDIFMTTNALLGNFKVCSTKLGAKIHKVKDPGESLGPMFRQVIGTLFSMLSKNPEILLNRGIEHTIVFGDDQMQEPSMMTINTEKLRQTFNNGMNKYGAVLKEHLSQETYNELKKVCLEVGRIDCELWARILYDLLAAYQRTESKELLLEAVQPLYFGRVYSFAKETANMPHYKAEMEVVRQARTFFRQRDYALKKLVQMPFVTHVAK